jgi:transposase
MKKLQRRVERFKGNTLGLDLHKKLMQDSVLNQVGDETENERLPATPEALTKLIDRLTGDGTPVQVVVEASGCFLWAYDLLVKKLGKANVHVAAPSLVKVIAQAGEKTDATDAWWLAYLQYDGRLPKAFVAEGDLRELRIACRERRRIVDERSDLVRRFRSHLAQLGLKVGKSDFKSVKGRASIAALAADMQTKEGMRGLAIAQLWKRIKQMDQDAILWSDQVSQLSKRFDEVKLLDDELAGVGPELAPIIYSELGDPRRYKSAKAYAKATGLTPCYRESAGHRSGKKMSREGSALVRWALTRAIVSCLRCKSGDGLWIKQWTAKMKRRKSNKAPIVAAARKLAEAVWRLFALGEAFDLSRAFGGPRGGRPRSQAQTPAA